MGSCVDQTTHFNIFRFTSVWFLQALQSSFSSNSLKHVSWCDCDVYQGQCVATGKMQVDAHNASDVDAFMSLGQHEDDNIRKKNIYIYE